MTMKSRLVGYVRKKDGALKISIDVEAFKAAETYDSKDGRQFVTLVANADKIGQILEGGREVTSLCQLIEVEP